MDAKVEVVGLAQLSRGLRKLDTEAPKQLRIALNGAATLLVSRTRPKVPSRSGAARASMKARSTRTSARVAVGGRKAPYFPWLDFGGAGRRPGRPAQRRFYPDGRYVYPTLKEIRPEIMRSLDEGIRAAARSAGLEVD